MQKRNHQADWLVQQGYCELPLLQSIIHTRRFRGKLEAAEKIEAKSRKQY